MKYLTYLLSIIFLGLGLQSCIEDGFTNSPSDQPRFSVDTLQFGTVFTNELTPTHRFVVHNPHSKGISISDISISGSDAGCFRLNVDGISGERFSGVEVRGRDSIFVFVSAHLPERAGTGTDYEASIDFTTNGVKQSVPVKAYGQNVVRLRAQTLATDTRLTAEKPYQIYDSLVVAEGATLTLEAGARLCFHDKAELIVRGRLLSLGTAAAPVVMGGDRTGNVVADISFEIMSRQWKGVFFAYTSTGNELRYTTIRNTTAGVIAAGDPYADYRRTPQLKLINCVLTNSGDLDLYAYHTAVTAIGCEFSEASNGLVGLHGGTHSFSHCTFANNYLFTAIGGPAVILWHISSDPKTGLDDESGMPYMKAEFANSIFAGLGLELSHGDLSDTDIFFRRCLFKSEGSDDDNFLECLWEADPKYYTVREDYIFDYRLREGSDAIGAADPKLMPLEGVVDRYGKIRGKTPDLGAYVYVPEESSN